MNSVRLAKTERILLIKMVPQYNSNIIQSVLISKILILAKWFHQIKKIILTTGRGWRG